MNKRESLKEYVICSPKGDFFMELVIHSPRLRLEALSIDLFPSLLRANYFPAHLNAHLQTLQKDPSLYGWGPWIIFLNTTGEVVGDIGFKGKPHIDKEIEVGYGICKNQRRRGYASEALSAVLSYAFDQCRLARVTAECRHDNTGSIRVLEKAGMLRAREQLQMVHWQLTLEQFMLKRSPELREKIQH